jgi:formate hydrogenlyase subunit 6/NADH:ubiquinone oxidoreductase subunit I
VEGGYVVHTGSEHGVDVLVRVDERLSEVKHDVSLTIEAQRKTAVDHIASQTEKLPDAREFAQRLAGTEGDSRWEPWAGKCVECGACTAVCPTCHCCYLMDTVSNKGETGTETYSKIRTWDSCLFGEYARMAGVGFKLTPRLTLRSRLANRLLHKYVYSFAQYNMSGCLGCGRCDEACLGRIDLREMISSVGEPS